jgi:peptidoglycan hydrolase-like protein with peptidoglycan-binding domain
MIKLKTILLEASKASFATPSEYSGDNGNANKLNLTTVYGVTLDIEAAANYKKMIDDMKLAGVDVNGNKVSGFRSYEVQYNLIDWNYLESTGNYRTTWNNSVTAAPPGKSNHGWGKAIDLRHQSAAQKWIRENGVPYGWTWYRKDGGEGESIGEPWHFTYRPDKVGSDIQNREVDMNDESPEITGLQYGDRGTAVTDMQQHLMYLDFSVGPRMDDGIFGPYTKKGVESFQRDHDLSVNGVFDSDTEAKLDDLTKQVPDNQIQYKIDSLKKSKSKNTDTITNNIPYDSGTVKKWDNNVIDALDIAALDYDIPKEILYTIANIESTGNPNAKNKSTSASGLFQIMPRFFKDYGVTKDTVLNPFINAEAAAKMMKKHMSRINKIIDSKDQSNIGAYIYMTHQQGLAGFEVLYVACKMYSNLGSKESLIKAAVSLNRSESFGKRVYRNMKANGPGSPCEFINTWTSKYDRNVQEISGKL